MHVCLFSASAESGGALVFSNAFFSQDPTQSDHVLHSSHLCGFLPSTIRDLCQDFEEPRCVVCWDSCRCAVGDVCHLAVPLESLLCARLFSFSVWSLLCLNASDGWADPGAVTF